MQNLQTAEETYSLVLHQLPATMAKRDRPVLRAWLEADIATGPRSALRFTMATAARLASSLELFELQRTYALAETATETKEREEDSETGASTHDTSAGPNDDAAHGPSGLHGSNGHNTSDAYDVSSADHAIPHAADGRKHAPATATAATKHGEDAGTHAGTCTQHE